MTVAGLSVEMDSEELHEWIVLHSMREEEREKQERVEKAKRELHNPSGFAAAEAEARKYGKR